jgi:hypothetical protein
VKWRVGGAVERLTVGWWGIRMQIGSVSSESRGNDTLSTTLKFKKTRLLLSQAHHGV